MVVAGYGLGLDLSGNCSKFGSDLDVIVQSLGWIWWACGCIGGGGIFFFLGNFGGDKIGVFGSVWLSLGVLGHMQDLLEHMSYKIG